jgi:small subunit ribosomal protein S18
MAIDKDEFHLSGRHRRSRKKCRSCVHIDYKDVPTLRRYVSQQGKIYSRKRAQTCSKCQRLVKKAVKRARFMGILSYTG